MKKARQKKHFSKTMILHYTKLTYRSLAFIAFTVLYILTRFNIIHSKAPMGVIWIMVWFLFVAEMVLRLFPAKIESMGCQKQFAHNHKTTEKTPVQTHGLRILAVGAAWTALNAAIYVLYFTHIIDAGIMMIVCLFYSVCDLICILFFCPFQTWFMKNKCCVTCRIYNWDYAMMFTPLIVIPHLDTWSLLAMAVVVIIAWEITYRLHPERFSEASNATLACANCTEKLCHHKSQLRAFQKRLYAAQRNKKLKQQETTESME